jgi:uncharacterized protein (DUF849 family)
VTLLFGAGTGTIATPQSLLATLDAVPDEAVTFIRATGPNQFPLTSLAFFLGAHPVVGMQDNLFLDPETPVHSNAQLVRRVVELAQHAQREIADTETARQLLRLLDGEAEHRDLEA